MLLQCWCMVLLQAETHSCAGCCCKMLQAEIQSCVGVLLQITVAGFCCRVVNQNQGLSNKGERCSGSKWQLGNLKTFRHRIGHRLGIASAQLLVTCYDGGLASSTAIRHLAHLATNSCQVLIWVCRFVIAKMDGFCLVFL